MAIFGGNLLCRASLGLQCRVLFIPWMKKSSGIRCSSGGANNSSFPVKYIPKKVRSTEKLQTSSTPKKDLKDKVNINGLEENELRLEISNGRKSSQTEKPRTSSAIMKAPKDNTSNNGLDENELRLEVSNDRKSSQTEKLRTSCAVTKGPEDNTSTNGLDENELWLEVSNDGKSSQTEKLRTSAITKGPKDNTSTNGLDKNELRLEVSNDWKSSRTEKLRTSSAITTGPKDNTSTNGLDENELRLEVSNARKSSQTEKLWTSSAITTGPKDNTSTNGSDENELRLEVSNDRKSSQTEKLRTSSAITKGPKDNTSTNQLDENELRLEVSNGGKSSQRSFVLGKKSQNQYQTPAHYAAPDVNQEAVKGIDFDERVLETECIEELEEVLEEFDMNEEMNLHSQDVLQVGKTKQDAENLAIELLATRAYTAAELRKKLQGKRFPLDTVDAVILDFQSRGLINDSLFAETFSQSRWSSSSWGPRRIKQALLRKGVREAEAEKAINYVFKDGDSDEEEESMHGLSKISMDKLLAQASKQWLRGRDATKEKRKTRVIRWLQYRGFNWGVISFVVKKLESQCLP